MPERSTDRIIQARRDLENAKYEMKGEFHEFACFLSQQSAEEALKAAYQKLRTDVVGHSITALIQRFPQKNRYDQKIMDEAKELDQAYIPTRYPDSYPEGAPFMMYSEQQSRRLISFAEHILRRCESILSEV